MTQTQTQDLETLSPFFQEINRYDEPKSKTTVEDEMVGKASNRVLDKKWNIKIQVAADFFTETLAFITSMGYNTVIGLSPKMVKIYKIAPDNSHLAYVTIDKTEMSEYINNDFALPDIMQTNQPTTEQTEPPEEIIYVEFDFLDELYINNKYPVDIYFDTKDLQRMYIVNAKAIESRRINDEGNENASISTYKSNYAKVFNFIKHSNTVSTTYNHPSLSNILLILEKKKVKKDKKSSGILEIKFGISETEFLIGNENESHSSSIQMYGDDIALRPLRESSMLLELDFLVKLKKLKFGSNVTFHVNEGKPIVIETRFGAGKVRLFYIIAPRVIGE